MSERVADSYEPSEEEIDFERAIPVIAAFESFAKQWDEDYREGRCDGVSGSAGKTELGSEVSASTAFTVQKLRGAAGNVEGAEYGLTHTLVCPISLEQFPLDIRQLTENIFPDDILDDEDTKYSVEFKRQWVLDTNSNFKADVDIHYYVDDVPVPNMFFKFSESEEAEDEPRASTSMTDDDLNLLVAMGLTSITYGQRINPVDFIRETALSLVHQSPRELFDIFEDLLTTDILGRLAKKVILREAQ